jgi:uncharacterized protein
MIIDFHTHIFPDDLAQKAVNKLQVFSPQSRAFSNGTAAGLVSSMNSAGIDKAISLPIATKPEQVDTIVRSAIALQSSDRIIPFATLHPLMPDFDRVIETIAEHGIRGVKFHPEYQGFFIDDPRYFPLYEALAARQLIVVFHAGKDPGPFSCDHALPNALKTVCRHIAGLTVIASHMGGWQVWNEVESILAGERCYLDTSAVADWMPPEQFVRLARKQGTDRILFGTDSPWFDQKKTVDWVDSLPLTTVEKERIFSGNALHLLAL